MKPHTDISKGKVPGRVVGVLEVIYSVHWVTVICPWVERPTYCANSLRSDVCLTLSEGLNRYGAECCFPEDYRGGVGTLRAKSRGYESAGLRGGPQWARSSGTAQKSCCHRTGTSGLQRVGEGSIQAPPFPYPATSPARGCCQKHTPPVPSPPGHQDTPRFCRNSDLTPICSSWFSNKTPLFLHTNLAGWWESGWQGSWAPHCPAPLPTSPELTC